MVKISVIIPIYNMENYLAECLDSVISQSLREIEIICINDGSTDNTQYILDQYKKKDNRIKVFCQTNAGLSVARNEGIKYSNGKYLIYLDADDKLQHQALKELYFAAEKYKYDIVYFSAKVFTTEKGNVFIENEMNRLNAYYLRNMNIQEPIKGTDAFINMFRGDKYLVSACLQMIRKKYLLESNVKFCEGLLHEDNLYTFFTLFNANKVGCLDREYYMRRIRSNSIMTSRYTHRNVYGLFISYDKILQSLDRWNISDIEANNYIDLYLKRLIDESIRIYLLLTEDEKQKFLNDISERQKRLFKLNKEIGDIKWTINDLESKKLELNNEIEHIMNSLSYKVGRVITYLPRICRRKLIKLRG